MWKVVRKYFLPSHAIFLHHFIFIFDSYICMYAYIYEGTYYAFDFVYKWLSVRCNSAFCNCMHFTDVPIPLKRTSIALRCKYAWKCITVRLVVVIIIVCCCIFYCAAHIIACLLVVFQLATFCIFSILGAHFYKNIFFFQRKIYSPMHIHSTISCTIMYNISISKKYTHTSHRTSKRGAVMGAQQTYTSIANLFSSAAFVEFEYITSLFGWLKRRLSQRITGTSEWEGTRI